MFLQIRNPSKNSIEELIQQIFDYELNSNEGVDWQRAATKNFNDSQNKFLDNVEELINKFKDR